MFDNLLRPEVQQYIFDHLDDDINELLLKHKEILDVSTSLIADQIKGREKAKTKLPTYCKTQHIIFPPSLNLEQCSSERTADFKIESIKSLISKNRVDTCADLTGGFGIDSFFFSQICKQVDFVDVNENLLAIARHNHRILGAHNISYHEMTASDFIRTSRKEFDLIYIDPSRRKENKKTFLFTDCQPDVVQLQELIFSKSKYLLLKTSPLLDIQSGISELTFVKKIFVVSVNNECKEVLFFCERGYDSEPLIEAVNLQKNTDDQSFSFALSDEKNASVNYSSPRRFLYEPNASILKAGAFKLIASHYPVHKLHGNTHLYTSDNLIERFPGKTFEIEGPVKSSKTETAKYFPEGKANITKRNYPLSVEQIKIKTGLNDGGDKYLIALTSVAGKQMFAAKRII